MQTTSLRRLPGLFTASATVLVVLALAPLAGADTEESVSLKDALTGGEVAVTLRYRFENVEEDAFASPARASTLRTTLGYRTLAYKGFSLYLEAENVTAIGADELHANRGAGSLDNGVRDRPVIADPEATEVEQAYLRFEGGKTRIDVGRQAIVRGDQRFVGPVAWRQNHQSFDAVMIENRSLKNVACTYAYLDNTNRIFGDNKPMASHLLDTVVGLPFGRLTLYGYWLDFDRRRDAGASSSTFGIELAGEQRAGSTEILFEVEYARQSDFADNPASVEADYLHARLGGRLAGITLEAGFERLDGSAEDGRFQTPLATLHKWNGWADKFLVTPATGLDDVWLALKGKAGRVAWQAVYHDFSAESTATDYGTEVDLLLTFKTPWGQVLGVKAAFYDADAFSTDTEKLWIWTSYSF